MHPSTLLEELELRKWLEGRGEFEFNAKYLALLRHLSVIIFW